MESPLQHPRRRRGHHLPGRPRHPDAPHPYHGQPKTHLASILNATAINLIRTDAWLNGTPLGTSRVSHLARLDLAA
jgi:hypothetical protein